MNYAARLPQEKNNLPYPNVCAVTQQSQAGVPLASSVVTLSPNTTTIEITALGGAAGNSAIIGKWGSASVTSSNFDFMIESGNSKLFVIPVSVFGAPLASVAGANAANGLFNSLALKTATGQSCSVFSVEYT